MTDYEIAEQERATLYERIKLVKEEMQSIADPQELAKQKQRYSILYQMYQEALERKDAARPPAERVRTAPKSRVTSFEARSSRHRRAGVHRRLQLARTQSRHLR